MSTIVVSQIGDQWVSWSHGEIAPTGFRADAPAADVFREIARRGPRFIARTAETRQPPAAS